MSRRIEMHGDHPRSCLCCASLEIAYEETGYCDSCAGSTGAIRCKAKMFVDIIGTGASLDSIAHLAQGCAKFKERT